MEWLRRNRRRTQRILIVSSVSVEEFLEGCRNPKEGMAFLSSYIPQVLGIQHAIKCAGIQRKARKRGMRFGENDAWQLACAERAGASIVGRDRKAFLHLGARYERFA